jgi:hypothetical protein
MKRLPLVVLCLIVAFCLACGGSGVGVKVDISPASAPKPTATPIPEVKDASEAVVETGGEVLKEGSTIVVRALKCPKWEYALNMGAHLVPAGSADTSPRVFLGISGNAAPTGGDFEGDYLSLPSEITLNDDVYSVEFHLDPPTGDFFGEVTPSDSLIAAAKIKALLEIDVGLRSGTLCPYRATLKK